MSLTDYEREVIINWNDEEEDCTIYTASNSTMTKCKSAGYEVVRKDIKSGRVIAMTFRCPKKLIKLGSKRKKRKG